MQTDILIWKKTSADPFLSLRLVRPASGGSARVDNHSEKERFPTSGNDSHVAIFLNKKEER
jgi:hypothetical protein